MKNVFSRMAFLTAVLVAGAGAAPLERRGETAYFFNQKESKIDGSIHYAVVGNYEAVFEKFSGNIYFSPQEKSGTVRLEIDVRTIKSAFTKLDDIVRSRQILDAGRYPYCVFTGDFQQDAQGTYQVKGELTLHGVTRPIEFPFAIEGPAQTEDGLEFVTARGKWIINRKEFGIIWNKLLDRAGVIVGNHMTVDWTVRAFR